MEGIRSAAFHSDSTDLTGDSAPMSIAPSREREKLYIFSSHLGLIRCLTPVRVSAIIYFQAFLDKHRNTTNIILPHKLNHGSRMLSKQP